MAFNHPPVLDTAGNTTAFALIADLADELIGRVDGSVAVLSTLITDDSTFNDLISDTNADGWAVDDFMDFTSLAFEIPAGMPPQWRLIFDFTACGDQRDDCTLMPTKLDGQATFLITDTQIHLESLTAQLDESAWEEPEPDEDAFDDDFPDHPEDA